MAFLRNDPHLAKAKVAGSNPVFRSKLFSRPSSPNVGGGWLVFALPPGEVAVHPSDENDVHEFYLMCDDVKAFIDKMKKAKVACSSIHEERWGSLVHITLPGGGKLAIYQPKHPLAIEKS